MDPKAGRQPASLTLSAPRVSAIVVAGPQARALELCLRAALADPWIDELVIVDVGLEPALSAALRGLKADRRDVRLLVAPETPKAEASNLGAAHARGRWLLFLDPAVVLKRGAAARLVSAGRRAQAPWISGGRVLDSNGRERPSVRRGHPTAWSAFFGGGQLMRPTKRLGREPAIVAAVSGDMLLTPRFDFEALGGFDVDGVTPLEALDLCRRASLAGGEVRFTPRAEGVVFAPEAARPAAQDAKSVGRYLHRSANNGFDRAMAMLAAPAFHAWAALRATFRRID